MNETQQLVSADNTVRDNFQARRILLLPRETAEEWSFDRLLSRGLEQRDRMRMPADTKRAVSAFLSTSLLSAQIGRRVPLILPKSNLFQCTAARAASEQVLRHNTRFELAGFNLNSSPNSRSLKARIDGEIYTASNQNRLAFNFKNA